MTSVTVANAYGSATTTAAFTPVPGAITAVSPGTAPVGTHITISGDFDLSPYTQLTFHGGVTVPASPAGSGNVTAVVPAGPDLWRAFRRAHPVLARLDELRHRKDGFVFLELTPADQAEDPPQSSSNATAST